MNTNIDYILKLSGCLNGSIKKEVTRLKDNTDVEIYDINNKFNLYHITNNSDDIYVIFDKKNLISQFFSKNNDTEYVYKIARKVGFAGQMIKLFNIKDVEIKLKQVTSRYFCDESILISTTKLDNDKILSLKSLSKEFKSDKEKSNENLYTDINNIALEEL